MEPSEEFIDILNTIPVEGLEMMSNAGIAFEINDGKIVGMISEY